MPLEYFYKLRILTITYNAYYNLKQSKQTIMNGLGGNVIHDMKPRF